MMPVNLPQGINELENHSKTANEINEDPRSRNVNEDASLPRPADEEAASSAPSVYSSFNGFDDENSEDEGSIDSAFANDLAGLQTAAVPWRSNIDSWRESEDYWPRRLLHIPTLISHERSELPVYGDVEKPNYSVLSYTWGRFQVWNPTQAHSLPIQGVTWEIPTIQDNHFTVEAFHAVLSRISLGTEWAWIDVACIDQEDDEVKMSEIGRQAAIFRKAKYAYVWLSHISFQPCFNAMAVIEEVGLKFGLDVHADVARLPLLEDAFGLILSDPWFSSLWTLQELMMRNEAMILSSEGNLIMWCENPLAKNKEGEFVFPHASASKRPMSFGQLSSTWRIHIDALLKVSESIDSKEADFLSGETATGRVSARMRELALQLQSSGIAHTNSNNPHVQYGAAKYRKTWHAEDRIYAIMQIYGLRVGQALRPGDRPSLDDLKKEFGLAINSVSLVQGQMFVHTSTPRPGQTWCITEDSEVPEELRDCTDVRDAGTIVQELDGTTLLTGQVCPFAEFLDLHDGNIHPWSHSMALLLCVYLDQDSALLVEPEANPTRRWEWFPPSNVSSETSFTWEEFGFPDYKHELAHKISATFGAENLLIFRLGDVESFTHLYNGGLKPGGSVEVEELKTKVGKYMFRPPRKHIGLVLHKLSADDGDVRASYERLGVCSWVTTPLLEDYQVDTPDGCDWQDLQGFILNAYEVDTWAYSNKVRALFQTEMTIKMK